MAIVCYSGLPGKGKTASATYDAIKYFKKMNRNINIRNRIKGWNADNLEGIWNNIYSNYPILLKKSKTTPIYSNIINLDDLAMKYQLPSNSMIIIDEAQRYYDSREFDRFPKQLGVFFQHHRHADVKKIILVTQHPRRLDNKMRDLCETFRKFRNFIVLPFITIVYSTDYYEFDDYGKYNHIKKEVQTYDLKNNLSIRLNNNMFNRYDSKYFSCIFNKLPHFRTLPFFDIKLSDDELKKIGIKM